MQKTTIQLEEKKLWVTRKGATSARAGEYGIIPGSMGAITSECSGGTAQVTCHKKIQHIQDILRWPNIYAHSCLHKRVTLFFWFINIRIYIYIYIIYIHDICCCFVPQICRQSTGFFEEILPKNKPWGGQLHCEGQRCPRHPPWIQLTWHATSFGRTQGHHHRLLYDDTIWYMSPTNHLKIGQDQYEVVL